MRSGVSSRPAASTHPADADDDAACARSGGRGTMNAAAASRADDAASWARGCDDDGASCVCGCDHGPWHAHGAAQVCCTRCSTDCCETPARYRPDPGRSLEETCYFSGGAPGRRMTYSHLVNN